MRKLIIEISDTDDEAVLDVLHGVIIKQLREGLTSGFDRRESGGRYVYRLKDAERTTKPPESQL